MVLTNIYDKIKQITRPLHSSRLSLEIGIMEYWNIGNWKLEIGIMEYWNIGNWKLEIGIME